jgi:hypothetical protein
LEISFECPPTEQPFGAFVHTYSSDDIKDKEGGKSVDQSQILTDPNHSNIGDFVVTVPDNTVAISPNFGCNRIAGNNWGHADNTGRWIRLVNWVNKVRKQPCAKSAGR